MWPDEALVLIKQHGIWGIGGSDGCRCCDFKILGIHVNVSCHKSEHCVRVYSNYLYRDPMELEPVAREVIRQLAAETAEAESYRLRFCAYECDHHNGRWEGDVWAESYKCCYCNGARPEREAYLCERCLGNQEAREHFPWTKDGFFGALRP